MTPLLLAILLATGPIPEGASTPIARVDFNTGCTQTVAGLGALGLNAMTYTGPLALWQWQWGLIAVNPYTSAVQLKNGLGKSGLGFCQPAINVIGDCWQSVTYMRATPGTPKWIVAAGAPYQCHTAGGPQLEGLQVWTANANGVVAWKGFIPGPARENDSQSLRLDGDYAFARRKQNGSHGQPVYVRFDLNAMTCDPNPWPNLPPIADQPGIDGFTYRLFPNPAAPVYYALRSGVAQDTPTPGPSLTPSKTPTRGMPTRTATRPPAGCCDPGINPCPKGVPPCTTPTPTFIPSRTRTPSAAPSARPSPSSSATASPTRPTASRTPTAASTVTSAASPTPSPISTQPPAPTVTPNPPCFLCGCPPQPTPKATP